MDAFSRFEQAGWAAIATDYERSLGRVTDRVVGDLLDAARVTAGTRLLDLACGPGQATAEAAGRGATAVGIDLSPAMVALARTRHPALEFREASAEELPFPASSFDAVAGNFLLHHLAEPRIVLAECARVLAPGGRLALTAWDLPERARFVGVLVDAIAEVGAAPPPGLPAGPDFFRYARPGEMAALFRECGFTCEVSTVAFELVISAGELWDGFMAGTVRTAAHVRGQPAATRERIRAAFDRHAAPYERGGRLAIPVSAVLAAGEFAQTNIDPKAPGIRIS
ncbi:class I SAM-dependent methyltransferase [Actinoplanes sp. CA-142083]|uniref:class I SAM-dependent methyltransferase n=1 Tax=Actinoplanes sp. CA-142083 TaxID=3239903 RepID=UPI003D8FB096